MKTHAAVFHADLNGFRNQERLEDLPALLTAARDVLRSMQTRTHATESERDAALLSSCDCRWCQLENGIEASLDAATEMLRRKASELPGCLCPGAHDDRHRQSCTEAMAAWAVSWGMDPYAVLCGE